jgi:putative ABC transport system permease protein
MKLSKNLSFSLEILFSHKLRTGLSLGGVVAGVAAVVLTASAGKGAEQNVLGKIRSMGTDLVVVNAGRVAVFGGRRRSIDTVTTLRAPDAEAIAEECPSVSSAAPAVVRQLAVRSEGETTNTSVLAVSAEGFPIRGLRPGRGRFFTEEDGRARARVAVIGRTVRRNLFGSADPVGRTIRIGRVPFEVAGVFRAKGADINGTDQDDVVIVPLLTALRRLFNQSHVDTIYVRARGAKALGKAEKEIRALLRKRHRLGRKDDDFTVQNQSTLLETEQETARSLTLLIGSAAGLSLFVGGIGILAVMLISVGERTHEIGLRRAVGARRTDIRNQFLFESALLSITGGLLGAAAGLAGTTAFPLVGLWEAVISWPSVGIGVGISLLLGMVFGLYPALRAASLQPVEALRAE